MTSCAADRPFDLAVLGLGALGEAIVTGLSTGPEAPRILVSGRSAERSARLAATHANVEVDPDNQSLVDRARTIVVAVRPQDAVRILTPLRFADDHAVVSVMAALSITQLGELVGPAAPIARAIPHVGVARRAVATPVFPATDQARAIFGPLGGAIDLATESDLDSVSVASATVAAHLEYVGAVADWLTDQGLAREQAVRLLGGIFAETSHELRDAADPAALAAAHATPGGLNERFAAHLRTARVFDAVADGLDLGLESVRGDGLTRD